MSDVNEGLQIVTYWRDMITRTDIRYDPSCDHSKGAAVIAYIDSLIVAARDAEDYLEHVRDNLAYSRQMANEERADHRAEIHRLRSDHAAEVHTLRARIRELDEALSYAEHRLTWR